MLKVITIVRTRNEERNIARFILSYVRWVDKILVADGGSTDNTMLIASSMPKTEVRMFGGRRLMKKGLWRNPEGEHINFLNDWAIEEGADWILFDDCDCFPNYLLKEKTRDILSNTTHDFVYAVRLYLWGNRHHLTKMSKPGHRNDWETSLWGWRANSGMAFEDTRMGFDFYPKPSITGRYNFYPPYCLLHNAWPTEEVVKQKMDFYHNSGQIPNILHPLEYGGDLEELPSWAYE